jgi:hypothetical protein
MPKIFFLIAAFVTITATFADNELDLCIQRKLKLSTPVSATQIMSGDFQMIPYAARSALQVCHPTFDIVAGRIFKGLAKPKQLPSDVDVKCFEAHLMRKETQGPLVASLDRAILGGFEGDSACGSVIENFTNAQIKQKMPNGTPAELQCLNNSIDKYMSGRMKGMVMAGGEYSLEIFESERVMFVRELREVSDDLIECLVGLQG